jgi:Tol biopolymer transport system component
MRKTVSIWLVVLSVAVGLIATKVVLGDETGQAPSAETIAVMEQLGTPVEWEEFSSPFISEVRQLTSEEMGIRRAGEGYFSPDGRYMIFQAEKDPENPFFQIFTMDLTTGEIESVSPGTGKTTCAFFRPGADEVEFASSHEDPHAVEKQRAEFEFRASGERRRSAWDYDEMMEIYVGNPDGTNLRNVTNAVGYDAEGAFSPDGKKIVFCSTRDAYPLENLTPEEMSHAEGDVSYFGEIYIMDADGSNPKRLTDWPGYDGGPFFTPSGQRIVWRHFDESGRVAEVYTMRLDGSDRRQLTSLAAMSWAPYFHPSGEYAIFTTNRHGFRNFEVYIVDQMGKKEPVRVTDGPRFDGLPVFTPDGNHLCWTASRTSNGQGQLFMARWDDAAARKALKDAPPRVEHTAATEDHSGHGH